MLALLLLYIFLVGKLRECDLFQVTETDTSYDLDIICFRFISLS